VCEGRRAEHFIDQSLLLQDEVKKIVARRRDFEYSLAVKAPPKAAFLRYVAYEVALENLKLKRAGRLGIRLEGEAAGAGNRLIHSIFDKAVKKYRGDEELWLQWIDFAERCGNDKKLQTIFPRVLQILPLSPTLWSKAAAYQQDARRDPAAARTLLQRGLRVNPRSGRLWVQLFRLELSFALRMRGRRSLLGLAGKDDVEEMEEAAVEALLEGADIATTLAALPAAGGPDEGVARREAALKKIMEGSVALIVLKNARAVLAGDLGLMLELLQALDDISAQAAHHAPHIYRPPLRPTQQESQSDAAGRLFKAESSFPFVEAALLSAVVEECGPLPEAWLALARRALAPAIVAASDSTREAYPFAEGNEGLAIADTVRAALATWTGSSHTVPHPLPPCSLGQLTLTRPAKRPRDGADDVLRHPERTVEPCVWEALQLADQAVGKLLFAGAKSVAVSASDKKQRVEQVWQYSTKVCDLLHDATAVALPGLEAAHQRLERLHTLRLQVTEQCALVVRPKVHVEPSDILVAALLPAEAVAARIDSLTFLGRPSRAIQEGAVHLLAAQWTARHEAIPFPLSTDKPAPPVRARLPPGFSAGKAELQAREERRERSLEAASKAAALSSTPRGTTCVCLAMARACEHLFAEDPSSATDDGLLAEVVGEGATDSPLVSRLRGSQSRQLSHVMDLALQVLTFARSVDPPSLPRLTRACLSQGVALGVLKTLCKAVPLDWPLLTATLQSMVAWRTILSASVASGLSGEPPLSLLIEGPSGMKDALSASAPVPTHLQTAVDALPVSARDVAALILSIVASSHVDTPRVRQWAARWAVSALPTSHARDFAAALLATGVPLSAMEEAEAIEALLNSVGTVDDVVALWEGASRAMGGTQPEVWARLILSLRKGGRIREASDAHVKGARALGEQSGRLTALLSSSTSS
jgi:hypothetical protein